jgi:lysophospholipase L1-like esterase
MKLRHGENALAQAIGVRVWRGLVAAAVMTACMCGACTNPNDTTADYYGNISAKRCITPTKRLDDAAVARHNEIVREVANLQTPDIAFIGDDFPALFDSTGKPTWNEITGNHKAVNMGVVGDMTQNVLWRLDNNEFPASFKPKYAVVMVGSNNGGFERDTPEMTAGGIQTIAWTIHEKSPDTRVIVCSLLPSDKDNYGDQRVNDILKRYNGRNNIYYLELADAFSVTPAHVRDTLYADKLNLSAAGYKLWWEKLQPLIR